MRILHILHVICAQALYRWAMSEINPLHPDLPKILLRQRELKEKWKRVGWD